jgi:hypothetical protein
VQKKPVHPEQPEAQAGVVLRWQYLSLRPCPCPPRPYICAGHPIHADLYSCFSFEKQSDHTSLESYALSPPSCLRNLVGQVTLTSCTQMMTACPISNYLDCCHPSTTRVPFQMREAPQHPLLKHIEISTKRNSNFPSINPIKRRMSLSSHQKGGQYTR